MLATLSRPSAAAALSMDYYVADFLLTPPPRIFDFFQTSSAFGDPLDLSDHPLLLDIFSLGQASSVLGWVFIFFFKVYFKKHPIGHTCRVFYIDPNVTSSF